MDAIMRSIRISSGEQVRNEVLKQQINIEGVINEDIFSYVPLRQH